MCPLQKDMRCRTLRIIKTGRKWTKQGFHVTFYLLYKFFDQSSTGNTETGPTPGLRIQTFFVGYGKFSSDSDPDPTLAM